MRWRRGLRLGLRAGNEVDRLSLFDLATPKLIVTYQEKSPSRCINCNCRSRHSSSRHTATIPQRVAAMDLAIRPALLSCTLLGGMLLVSCGSPQRPVSEATSAPAANPSALQNAKSQSSSSFAAVADAPSPAPSGNLIASRTSPTQLVKKANLEIRVDSIATSLQAVTSIAQQQQGDLLELNESTPTAGNHRTAALQIRVPQPKLDATIAALAKLGTVENQSQTAEDVSGQLVDHQARLRNLRKAEETVLKIMDRSGNVADVLKVAQELNNIRGEIEQINGQLSDLQNSVAYSTIDLTLRESIVVTPLPPSTATQLQNTWKGATRSIGKVTVDLLQIGIWLMVYSPYLLILSGITWAGYSRSRRSASRSTSRSSEAID